MEQPAASPEEWLDGKDGYQLTEDLTDKAIGMIADAKQVAPDRPFFMYFCPGAYHAPHHTPRSGLTSTRASSTWATRSIARTS